MPVNLTTLNDTLKALLPQLQAAEKVDITTIDLTIGTAEDVEFALSNLIAAEAQGQKSSMAASKPGTTGTSTRR